MKEQILSILEEKRIKSGGHNGTYVPILINELNTTYSEIRIHLNELFKEKKIIIRPGQRGDLIFINKKN